MSLDTTSTPDAGGPASGRAIGTGFSWNRHAPRPRVGRVARVAARRADGSLICLSDLPDGGQRWTRLRKQAVVECVAHGLVRGEAVCGRYGLSAPELEEWQQMVAGGGRHPRIWRDRPRARTGGVLTSGAVAIDLDAGELRLGGRAVALAPSEWSLLRALAEAGGAVVTNSMLMGVLYATPDEAAGPKIADVLICRLRKKLGAENGRIVSVWGRGYRLEV